MISPIQWHVVWIGEANRLVAWLVKASQAASVMRMVIQHGCLPHLVSMVKAEHVVMQNEALVALTFITSSILGWYLRIACIFLSCMHTFVFTNCFEMYIAMPFVRFNFSYIPVVVYIYLYVHCRRLFEPYSWHRTGDNSQGSPDGGGHGTRDHL